MVRFYAGRTALMYACSKGNMDVINLMLRAGSNLDSKDMCGRSVVDYGLTRTNFDAISTCISSARDRKSQSRAFTDSMSRDEPSTCSFNTCSSVSGDFSQRGGSPSKILSPYNPKNALKSTLELGTEYI